MRQKHVRMMGHLTSTGQTEYIGLLGDRWQTLEIPYADRVHLVEAPIGLLYIPGSEEAIERRDDGA